MESAQLGGRNVVIRTKLFNLGLARRIVGSCNGLICLASGDERVALCNPLTGKSCRLTNPPNVPSHLQGWFGFGYDCVSRDYKIVRILRPGFNHQSGGNQGSGTTQIYSSSTRSWRQPKGVVPPFDFGFMSGPGVYSNNTLHWLTFESEHYSILTFDLHSEEFGKKQLPCKINQSFDFYHSLTVSCGLLYYLWSSNDNKLSKHSIWVMKKYGVSESWTELYTFTKDDVKLEGATLLGYRSEKGGGSGKALMKETNVTPRPSEHIWYNCEDKSIRKVDILDYRGFHNERPLVCIQPWLCNASIAPIP